MNTPVLLSHIVKFFVILFVLVGLVFSSPLIPQSSFADCNINTDWPDAPCMDEIVNGRIPQHQVDQWAEYYDYKGELWMKQKQYEMQQAIQTDSLGKWLDLAESHRNVHYYYYLQGEAPDPNGKYVFTCNMYEDLSHYEEILKDDMILKKFLEIFPSATSSIAGGIDESRPPQTSIIYQFETYGIDASLLMRVFEGDNKEPCLVPRVYTLTYQDASAVTEIRNSNFDTDEILGLLELLPFRQSPLKQFQSGISLEEIQCRDSLVLMAKHNGSPICVKSETKEKLIERGWEEHSNKDGTTTKFSFCGEGGFDSQGNLNKSNSTHIWDENYCKWWPAGYDPSLYQEKQKQLQMKKILDHCSRVSLGLKTDQPYLQYENKTHIITSDTCEWRKMHLR